MFTKLLKQEWKATSKLLGILSLAALGVGVLEAMILRSLFNGRGFSDAGTMVLGAMGSMVFFLTLAIMAYAISVQIILIARFYKNKFTDEGYLTFTLPVSSHEIFLSSLVNMVIWTVISGAVTAVCIFIIVAGGTSSVIDARFWQYLWQAVVQIFEFNAELVGGAYWPLMIISAIVGLFSSPAIIMTAFTLGAVIAKKHKILAAFGMAYAISMATNIVATILLTFVGTALMNATGDAETLILQFTYYIDVLLQLALLIGGYILSVWLMRNKLNLS